MTDDQSETLDGGTIGFTSLPEGVRQIGPYRLISEIGRGAMGTVYRAEHQHLSRTVALKVLPQELAASPDRYARFQREMQAIGRLEHPNIVLATDAGQIDEVCYIAMQLVEGVDLAQLIGDREILASGEACEIARQVALGLGEIDQHEMIHRDIKPSNLLLASNGEVKILDLGIASLRHTPTNADSLTMTGSFLGTPDYVAPEQISSGASVDIRADIYSLGCTLYHLLSGHAPFSGPEYKSLPAKLLGHAEKDAELLNHVNEHIPAELAAIVARMMAKNPNDRYRSPAEVVEALSPFCDGQMLDETARCFGEQIRARAKAALVSGGSPIGEDESTMIQQNVSIKKMPTWKKVAWGLAATLVVLACVGGYQGLTDAKQGNVKQVAAAEKIASHVGEIESDTGRIATSTEQIAMTLDQMQNQFREIASKINEDPQTPAQWYANAIIHAKSGNATEARRAYLQFFESNLNVVDPFQSFASLLRLQEGTAGARETFAAIPGDAALPARQLASIGLQPQAEQRERLQLLANQHPEFGPAYFALSETIQSKPPYDMTLTEKIAKKKLLDEYLRLHDIGQVLKYYLDQSQLEQPIASAQALIEKLQDVDEEQLNHPIKMSTDVSPVNVHEIMLWQGQLRFQFAEDARSPEYRFSAEDEFASLSPERPKQTTQFLQGIAFDPGLTTAETLTLPRANDHGEIEIRYQDRNGVARGPFLLPFDIRQTRQQKAIEWLTVFDKENLIAVSKKSIGFSGILSSGYDAIEQIRYGLNKDQPDQTFPIPTEILQRKLTSDETRVKPGSAIQFVVVQFAYKDGTSSELYRCEP
ncbi:Serine/threonine-protein kinase PknE [Rubripirellula tenax]|uniref:Serine/threonine-protein kinase PknE n=1 Tax=Rubripirellula tenax TaxID=2528015 RepID=A0A5C6EB85_9BACT|nr:serine/threonine-protein kinase [Rubripirellula tenax]TWU44756.1 Serine/threonine-protein kinase PknE [Rubripirellula tenax]